MLVFYYSSHIIFYNPKLLLSLSLLKFHEPKKSNSNNKPFRSSVMVCFRYSSFILLFNQLIPKLMFFVCLYYDTRTVVSLFSVRKCQNKHVGMCIYDCVIKRDNKNTSHSFLLYFFILISTKCYLFLSKRPPYCIYAISF